MLDEFKNILKEKGYKLTPQREKVLATFIKNKYKHLSSEEIYKMVKKDYPQIGLATIYRTIQIMEKENIICRFDTEGDIIKYELMDINEKYQHPHCICLKCGRVLAIRQFSLNSIKTKLEKKYNFTVVSYNFKFYGICKKCGELEGPSCN